MKKTKNKIVKQKDLTLEDIESKKKEFEETIKEEMSHKQLRTTAQQILFNTKEIILEARKNKLSYQRISEKIEQIYNYKISSQTIRIFVKKEEKENN